MWRSLEGGQDVRQLYPRGFDATARPRLARGADVVGRTTPVTVPIGLRDDKLKEKREQ